MARSYCCGPLPKAADLGGLLKTHPGAIEGVVADYELSPPFTTAFKFSRFDATSAPHRDVSQLTGRKHTAKRGVLPGSSEPLQPPDVDKLVGLG